MRVGFFVCKRERCADTHILIEVLWVSVQMVARGGDVLVVCAGEHCDRKKHCGKLFLILRFLSIVGAIIGFLGKCSFNRTWCSRAVRQIHHSNSSVTAAYQGKVAVRSGLHGHPHWWRQFPNTVSTHLQPHPTLHTSQVSGNETTVGRVAAWHHPSMLATPGTSCCSWLIYYRGWETCSPVEIVGLHFLSFLIIGCAGWGW